MDTWHNEIARQRAQRAHDWKALEAAAKDAIAAEEQEEADREARRDTAIVATVIFVGMAAAGVAGALIAWVLR